MSNPRLVIVSCLVLVLVGLPVPVVHGAETAPAAPWQKTAHLNASLTDVSANQVDRYQDVTGLSGTEESFSWIMGFDGTLERRYNGYSQEHRLHLRYGRIDGVESEDEIDLNNIGRMTVDDPIFAYGNARVRSEFDTFAHPTVLNLSTGLGTRLFTSDSYGELETRTGPRFTREWNPEVDWANLYELILEYQLTINKSNSFTSQLESYTLIDRPEDYTVRWDNNLTAAVNSWLDLRYSVTLYYEDTVGDLATRAVSTLNFVYHFYGKPEPQN